VNHERKTARRLVFRTLLLLAPIVALVALSGTYFLGGGRASSTKASSATGQRILLVSSDESDPLIARSIADLASAGFTVLADPRQALQAASAQDVVAFFVTRDAFATVPGATWRTLYQRSVIVGGLNVSLAELQPLILPGTTAGSGRVKYTADRAIFSLMYSLGGCGRGAMSDWLDNWPHLSGVVQQRALEVAAAESRGLPDVDCPADKRAGGSN
jgi:hypothetical protein